MLFSSAKFYAVRFLAAAQNPTYFLFQRSLLFYEHQLRQLPRLLLRRQIPQLFTGRRGALQQPAQRDAHDPKARIRARLRAVFPLAAGRAPHARGGEALHAHRRRVREHRGRRRGGPLRPELAKRYRPHRSEQPCPAHAAFAGARALPPRISARAHLPDEPLCLPRPRRRAERPCRLRHSGRGRVRAGFAHGAEDRRNSGDPHPFRSKGLPTTRSSA